MRWVGVLLATGIVAGIPDGHARAVSADVEHLAWRRAVMVPEPLGAARRVFIAEDSLLAAVAAPGFPDLRLMNAAGDAIPLDPLRPARAITLDRPFRELTLEWRAVAPSEWAASFDLGDGAPPVLIAQLIGPIATSSPRFMTSADGENWLLLARDPVNEPGPPALDGREVAPPVPPEVVPMKAGGRFRIQGVRRFLRLAPEAGAPQPASGDRLRLIETTTIATARVPAPFRVHDRGYGAGATRRWRGTLEFEGAPRLMTRIDLRALRPGSPAYDLLLEMRLPEGAWRNIYAGPSRSWLEGVTDSVTFEPVRTSALRLTVFGADPPNAPFDIVAAWSTPALWSFVAEPGLRYWLGLGDRFALPVESVALPLDSAFVAAPGRLAPTASLGALEPNPFHRDPGFGLEWLRRRPAVPAAAMVVILAWIAWLTLRRRRETAP